MKTKKIILIVIFMSLLLLGSTDIAMASAGGDIVSPFEGDLNDLISRVTFLIRPITLMVFLGMMIWGGYVRMTAAGNSDAEERSSRILTAAVIGFLIVAIAPIILSIAQQVIGIPSIL